MATREQPMKIYLAGPMRGIADFNYPAFDAGAAHLRSLGHEVFNPAQHDRETGHDLTGSTGNEDLSSLGFDLRSALGADLDWICTQADAVAVLPGWENSKGARAEVATALALGLTVGRVGDFHARGCSPQIERGAA
jgi:hypothetical protein